MVAESTIHIFGPTTNNSIRIRAWCPGHERLCYGRYVEYYDTRHLSFDCKVFVDMGYGYWGDLPGPQGGQKRRRIRKRDWLRWQPHMRRWSRKVNLPW